MDMFDERAYERRSKELIPVRMKIALEGFFCEVEKFEIAPELMVRRAPLDERQAFWSRTNNPKDVEQKALDNEFFAEFDFHIPRGLIQGLAPGNGINLVSIFFSVVSANILNINRGNFYLVNGKEFQSAGFYTMPNEYRFASKVKFTSDELNSLRVFWPSFKGEFEGNFSFALVARRYFYSQLRLNLEDRIIDLMITLEALLVPEKSGTKGEKIATRLAQMISPEHDSSVVRILSSEAYRLRNKIIHGGRAHLAEAFDIDLMSKYCRAAIRKYLICYKGLSSRQLIKVLSPGDDCNYAK
ncbi:HEPN domain-containing protein [Dawidia soli]|uniref:Apea-like HEPN domain-containing protein n=1 Tax=Dawidia soli TaxID=2782352 RepID=A0AAP2DEW1_9BACT|nr:HEPN domain-containing protein [Dawidia soli]MBT1689440.1 hypothetical protein [Dawidia soli]